MQSLSSLAFTLRPRRQGGLFKAAFILSSKSSYGKQIEAFGATEHRALTGRICKAAAPNAKKQDPKATASLPFFFPVFLSSSHMRCAFVVRLGSRSIPSEGRFEGCVEEVDSGKELKFRSAEELLQFLGDCFELIRASQTNHQTGKTEQDSNEC